MHPDIEALKVAVITFASDLIRAPDDASAIALSREFQSRIEATLAAVEVRT